MTVRHSCSAITAGLLTFGVAALVQTSGRAQSVNDLGPDSSPITLVGCLQRETDYRHQEGTGGGRRGMSDEYVLVNTTIGSVPSVTEGTCSTTNTGAAVELTGGGERHIDDSLVGRWVEVSGKLKHASLEEVIGTSGTVIQRPTGGSRFGHDLKLREVNVESFSAVPVIVPLAARAEPAPAIEPEPAPPAPPQAVPYAPPQEQPAVTTAPKQLPHTAGPLPLTGTIGLISLAGALALRALGRRRVLGRR
jgi:hypothetical protein